MTSEVWPPLPWLSGWSERFKLEFKQRRCGWRPPAVGLATRTVAERCVGQP
jgi:hypothetical protein